jgi:hypothetical protein
VSPLDNDGFDQYERIEPGKLRPEEELVPEPPHAPSAAEVSRALAAKAQPQEAWEEDEPPAPQTNLRQGRFSLAQMMLVVTVVAVLLGFLRAFPPASAAGLAGSVVLMATLYLALHQDAATWVWLVWGTLFGMYLLTALVALVSG